MNKYEVIFNTKKKRKNKYIYEYNNVKNICIYIDEQSAVLSFEMTVKKSFGDFANFNVSLFHDAYRKIHLLHSIIYNKGINVKEIKIRINNETKIFDEKNDTNFPFMFSILKANNYLNLRKDWKCIDKLIVNTTKSSYENDLRFAAINAYLISKTKEFEIDKFTNLWTAFNAIYNYIAKCYEDDLKKEYNFMIIETNSIVKLQGKDSLSMGALAWLIDQHYSNLKIKDLATIWNENIKVFNLTRNLSNEDIKKLCKKAKKLKYGENNEKYDEFIKLATRFSVNLYVFFLIIYPYHWRCKYLHGNFPEPLILAYNDYEMKNLNIFNYFLDEYLNNEIPKMFSKKYWSKKKFELVKKYMHYINTDEKGVDSFQKAIEKLKNEKKKNNI